MSIVIKIIKSILKFIFFLILAIGGALLLLIGSSIAFDHFYKRIYPPSGTYYISNNLYPYLINFTIFLITTVIALYQEDIKDRKRERNLELYDENASYENKGGLVRRFRKLIWLGWAIVFVGSYLSFNSYNIFYEDYFTKVRLLKEDKNYRIEDVQSFTVRDSKRFELMNFSMELSMKDGTRLELFGGAEHLTDSFDEKYNTYGYSVYINNKLLEMGVPKKVIGKEKILKEYGYMDGPHISHLKTLLEE